MLSPSSSSESSESVFNGSGAGTSSEPVTDEKLETILKQVQSQLPAENGTWAVFISDLVNGTEGSLNDQKMQAASLIKLYIMGAVYENYDQINVFESSFGKVKHSREFIITTDGYVRDGPLDEISSMCAEILETGENPLGYYPFICEIDSMKEVDIPDAWHKANPSMEYMPILANQIMHDYLEMKKITVKETGIYH